jgi:hypothetical protein
MFLSVDRKIFRRRIGVFGLRGDWVCEVAEGGCGRNSLRSEESY